MLDVVYKLGTKCGIKNYEELRYSLRSLENLSGLGRVFIIGVKPDWVTNVIHYSFPDSYTQNKDANLINKILFACTRSILSEEFLNFSDDQYLIKPVSIEDFREPPHCDHKPGGIAKWFQRMDNTIAALAKAGKPGVCYEAHCPYLINKKEYPVVLKYNYGEGVGMCGNSLYFNSIEATPGKFETAKDIFDLGDAKFLNLNNIVTTQYEQLKKMFPQKSKFEL
jgi:hypothetical protein